MDEIWERAVETALEGQTDKLAARTLTLDGAVKCIQGRLPAPSLFEKFVNLQHLSIANIGVSTLEQFPRLGNLEKLILSDNRISGGLEFLVEAGLDSLRDLDLSNNRIQYIEDLAPLAKLRLVSLDLYECPVTRLKDYRSRVFGLISSLKYLDKMDAEENERPESDDEEEDDDEDDEEDDPGSGEVDGEERPFMMNNGHSEVGEGIVDVDEEEESEADEEEAETGRDGNGVRQNGFRVEVVDRREEGAEGEEEGDEFGEEEIDEDDDDVVEVHEIGDDSDEDDDADAVEYEEEDDDDDDNEDDDEEDEEGEEEEVDNDEGDLGEPESTGRLTSAEGEIDGHEHGEDDGEEDDNGETGEEEQVVEDDGEFDGEEDGEEEDEDSDEGYLVQPVGQAEVHHDTGGSDLEPGNEEDDPEGEEEVDDDDELQMLPSSSHLKRKRDEDEEEDGEEEEDDDDEDVVEYTKSSSKKHR